MTTINMKFVCLYVSVCVFWHHRRSSSHQIEKINFTDITFFISSKYHPYGGFIVESSGDETENLFFLQKGKFSHIRTWWDGKWFYIMNKARFLFVCAQVALMEWLMCYFPCDYVLTGWMEGFAMLPCRGL